MCHRLLIFGGSAWVPDPDADNSYGYSTHNVNDLWSIDLSGADAYTWQAVHTVGDAPSPREGPACAMLGGRYLVVQGGYGHESGYVGDTHVLDTYADPMVWSAPTVTGVQPDGRHGATIVALEDNEILTFGGMSNYGCIGCTCSRTAGPSQPRALSPACWHPALTDRRAAPSRRDQRRAHPRCGHRELPLRPGGRRGGRRAALEPRAAANKDPILP